MYAEARHRQERWSDGETMAYEKAGVSWQPDADA